MPGTGRPSARAVPAGASATSSTSGSRREWVMPGLRPGAGERSLGGSGNGFDVGWDERRAACRAVAAVVDLARAAAKVEHHRPPPVVAIAVAPLHQRDEDGPQVEPLAGQLVLEAL